MKLLFYCILSYIFISTSRSTIFSKIKSNILSLVDNNNDKGIRRAHIIQKAHLQKPQGIFEKTVDTNEKAHVQIDPVLNSLRQFGRRGRQRSFNIDKGLDEKVQFRIDPILNSFRRHGRQPKISRRKHSSSSTSSEHSSSSSREFRDWKEEWKEKWIQKKFEAINSTYVPGDTVNMLAARPWGVPCGDPNQHDMPWGSCVLPMECDAEYRIYRGDFACGRSQFVCCALQLTNYDMYQGFDLSFEDSGLATDTQEKKKRGKGSKDDKKKHKQRQKRKRRNARKKRKRQIQRQIKKIQKEIKKIINRQQKNATKARKRKTKQLKKFIEMLKHQYKKDRKSVIDLHEYELIKIDDRLKKKLEQIREMNQNFIKNATFRDIIVNGTLNRQAARMLLEAYPELDSYININVRRRMAALRDYLDYDVEYGMLYY